MTKTASISLWLPLLRELVPPAGLILVGAGAGTSPWVRLLQEWNVPGTILIEADDAQFLQLQKNVARFGSWRLHKKLVAGLAETVTFHHTSNSAESSLLDLESLRSIWPNIKTRQRQSFEAITLASLQQEEDHSANWLMVDCLPALPIVQGAAELLDAFDVIVVRVVFDNEAFNSSTASQSELESYLNSRGYRSIATEAGRHPAVGHALYVRDTQQVIHRLRQQQVQQKQIHQAEVQNLAWQNSAAEQLASELQRQISQLAEAQLTADKLAAEREQRINQLEQANAAQAEVLLMMRDESAKTAEEHIAQVNALKQAKVAADQKAVEREQQIEQLKQNNASQADQLAQTRAKQTEAVAEHVAQVNTLTQAKAFADKLAAERQHQIDELAKAKAAVEKFASEKQQQLEHLAEAQSRSAKFNDERQQKFEQVIKQITSFSAQEHSSLTEIRDLLQGNKDEDRYEAISKKLDGLLAEQKTLLAQNRRGLVEDLNKGLGNTAKQIEAFIGVQNYLEHGHIPLNFHGWPISPDIASFLLEKIETEKYDLIIEFGSGTSTLLFAKALKNRMQRLNAVSNAVERITDLPAEKVKIAFNFGDETKKIISFEHDKQFYDKTKSRLEMENLENLVDLVYAPLVEYEYEEEEMLYYACGQKLDQVASSSGGQIINILVLVDGPPGILGPRSRFPALPHLLSKLGMHRIDLVLDDYGRKEEKEITESWKNIMRTRSISFCEEEVRCEKGAFFCRLN